MMLNKKIGVVIPAYNEEKLISKVILNMPSFVDYMIIVDDCSQDKTSSVVKEIQKKTKKTIILIRHQENQGVGGAIATGYQKSLEQKIDIIAVMGGDNQMDPTDLKKLVLPVIKGETDYAKGNRLFDENSWNMIPHDRYLGNAFLSLLTKIASGYWHIADSQCGYTVISAKSLKKMNLKEIYKRYGVPNDLLIKLNICKCRVADIPVKPVYNIGEISKMNIYKVIPKISLLLFRGFIKRMFKNYIIVDFHPLVFFYLLFFLLNLLGFGLLIRLIYFRIAFAEIPPFNALALVFFEIMAFQSLFFAMWFDKEYNTDLNGKIK